ncbi:MAG: hypothetical protein ACAI43_25380 [Phycisphaerae bacterium]
MPPPLPTQDRPADYRTRALTWAVRACATGVGDVLQWHPGADEIRRRTREEDADESLADILWDELVTAEQGSRAEAAGGPAGLLADPGLERGAPASYWLRRRRVGQWELWRAAASRLPRVWIKLIEAPAPVIRSVQRAVGIEMIARATAGTSSRTLVKFLAPLENDLAGRVVTRIRAAGAATAESPDGPGPVSAEIAARWRDAYERAAKMLTGDRLASTLGRGLLAAMFRQLPEAERRDVARLSKSTLAPLLEHDEFLEPVSADEIAWGGRMLSAPRVVIRLTRSSAAIDQDSLNTRSDDE